MPIGRRSLVRAAAAGLLAAPALAQPRGATTLRFIPQANLSVLDPIWTTAVVTSNHGFYVFDTLYGLDLDLVPKPQMAEGHEVSSDGLTWRFRLREGLRWHDGEPVRAVDCTTSLKRFCARDTFGQLLARVVEEWRPVDDRNFEIRLKRPFPLMLSVLGKPEGPAFIMPERLAKTSPTERVSEMVGSGPYKFVASEFNSGSRVMYEKFDGYVPRNEPPSRSAGGKVAHFPRIEWVIITDPSTSAAALMNDEIDWWERPMVDLQPMLSRNRQIRMEVTNTMGRMAYARLNHLQPPFDDVRVRRAVLAAVVQEHFMRATQGDDRESWTQLLGLYPRNTPYFAEHPDLMPQNMDKAKALLKESGYAGEQVVIINPTDFPEIGPHGHVMDDTLRRLGMNVDLRESDWGTVIQRRNSREPTDKGGWSIFHTGGNAYPYGSPASSALMQPIGERGWFGWWKNEKAAELIEAWLYAPDETTRTRLAAEVGRLALEDVATVPLGQSYLKTGYRTSLTGILPGSAPYPWAVRRA